MQPGAAIPNDVVSSALSSDGKTQVVQHELQITNVKDKRTAALLTGVSTVSVVVDINTHLPQSLLFKTHPDNDAATNLQVEIDFSDYRTVNGLTVGDTASFNGTFLFSNGTISTVAVTGDPAPGGGTLTFPGFLTVALNNQGQIAFDSGLSVGGFGVFLATPSTTPGSRPAASVVRATASDEVCTTILDTLVSRRSPPRSCR